MKAHKEKVFVKDPVPEEMEEQVRIRAYEFFEARGCEGGHDLDDWFRAEEEVVGQKSRATAA